jgi:nicotinamide-nucleotide amidase
MNVNPESVSLDEETLRQRAEQVAQLARASGRRVAVAESLTGGMIASSLAQAEGASEWFCGSLVAYSTEVKHQVLGVPPGPVVSAEAAGVMARRVRSLLLADIAVAVTGSGGPSAQDGHQPGTVFLALEGVNGNDVRRLQLAGDPGSICAATALAALDALLDGLDH